MAKSVEVHHHYAAGTNVTHVVGGQQGQDVVDALMQVIGGAPAAAFGEQAQAASADQPLTGDQQNHGMQHVHLEPAQVMVSTLAGALFGREHHGLKRQSAVRIASNITRSLIDEAQGNIQLALLALPFAVGYVNHGQGKYKITTIAARSVEAANSICELVGCEACAVDTDTE